MGEVPRHLFVEEALASRAYEDIALPLGFGQTISSPYTVARMTELAGEYPRYGYRRIAALLRGEGWRACGLRPGPDLGGCVGRSGRSDSRWQNGYVESFHGRFRGECRNREHFWTMMEAGGHRRLSGQGAHGIGEIALAGRDGGHVSGFLVVRSGRSRRPRGSGPGPSARRWRGTRKRGW